MYCHLSGTFQLDRKTDDYKNVTKTKHCNTLKHPPDSIWKLSISDKKSGNVMSVENPDQFIYSWVHYRLTYYKRKDKKKRSTMKAYRMLPFTLQQYVTYRNSKSDGLAFWSSTQQMIGIDRGSEDKAARKESHVR